MKDDLVQTFLNEARRLEVLVADLYTIFKKSFPEDYNFWHQLALEEKDHAALIDAIKANPNLSNQFVSGFAPGLLQDIQKINELLSSLIVKFTGEKQARKTAFDTAITVEKSAGEINYQNFMTQETDSWIIKGLQHINEYDRDHLNRIEEYMKGNKLSD